MHVMHHRRSVGNGGESGHRCLLERTSAGQNNARSSARAACKNVWVLLCAICLSWAAVWEVCQLPLASAAVRVPR